MALPRINPLTGLPEEENPAGMVEAAPLVDPNAAAAGLAPGVVPVLEAPTEMGNPGGSPSTAGPRGISPADAVAAGRAAAASSSAAAAASPGTTVLNFGGKESSTTRTSGSDREIVAPKVQAAAEKVEKQAQAASDAATNVQIAEQQANEAQTQYLQATKDAAKQEAEAKAESARAVIAGRAEAQAELQRREAEAAEKVKFAQDREDQAHAATQRTFWNDKPWFYEALAGIAVAASRRNLRAMGEDPNKSGVAQTITGLLEQDKAKKMGEYLRSKAFLEDAKKLPGKAREAYNTRLADLEAGQSAQLKLAAAEAEKLKATADADPEYVATQQQVLLAKSQELGAAAQLKYGQQGAEAAQMANPNEKRSSSTTRVDVDAPTGPPPAPMATVDEVKTVSTMDNAVKDYEQLADQIEADPHSWWAMQTAINAQRGEDSRNFKFGEFGSAGIGQLESAIGGALPDALVKGKAPIAGRDVENKLRAYPKAQEVYRGATKVVTATGLGYGGVLQRPDAMRAELEEGLASMSQKDFVKSLRKKASEMKAQSEQMKRQREFR